MKTLSSLVLALAAFAAGVAAAPPIRWVVPPGFNARQPGLGLPVLPGVTHEIIYAPAVSRAAVEVGGDGRYESALHGTYNHHTRALVLGDKVVVSWTNHSNDENGPGERMVARWGVLDPTRTRIDWGNPAERTFELAPAPVPVHRRVPLDATGIDRRYVKGELVAIDGRLRFDGAIMLNHGWTDDTRFRTRTTEPIPDERFRPVPDRDATHPYGVRYRYDMFWTPGPAFRQLWDFAAGKLQPASAVYLDKAAPESLALTPTQKLPLTRLLPPYGAAALMTNAPDHVRALLQRRPSSEEPRPRYVPGTSPLAADGKNALAHRAEFRRRDGTWVIIRDNLANPGFYYAAMARPSDAYPPAVMTNLPGDAMPAAGTLADGRTWILGNSRGRFDFYLTVSDDGVTFDRTWLILHVDQRWVEGFAKPARSGPQYPHVLTIGDALWVFYSIGKEQIGVTRIPFAAFANPPRQRGSSAP